MMEFEHGMLLVCFSATIGTFIGTFLGLLINLIGDLISKHRAKKRRLKENNDKYAPLWCACHFKPHGKNAPLLLLPTQQRALKGNVCVWL